MPEVALTFAFSSHGSENAIGTDFFKPFTVLVITHPNKHGLSNNVVFRNIPPLSSVQTVVAIVPHHPVIVLLKRVGTCQFSVNKSLAVFIDFQIIFVFSTNFNWIDFFSKFNWIDFPTNFNLIEFRLNLISIELIATEGRR